VRSDPFFTVTVGGDQHLHATSDGYWPVTDFDLRLGTERYFTLGEQPTVALSQSRHVGMFNGTVEGWTPGFT